MTVKIFKAAQIVIFLFAGTIINAQDCRLYFPDSKGAVREMKFYDAKDKMTSIARQEILEKIVSGKDVRIKVRSTNFTADEQEVYGADLEMICENGVFKIDMQSMLDPNTMSTYKDMGIEITADNISYPADFSVGQALPDGNLTMVVKNNQITLVTITLTVSDRQVVAREKITTEAGTFDCYKLTHNTTSKIGFITVNANAVEWIAEGVGVVRNESYNKRNKLTGYSVLTKLTK